MILAQILTARFLEHVTLNSYIIIVMYAIMYIIIVIYAIMYIIIVMYVIMYIIIVMYVIMYIIIIAVWTITSNSNCTERKGH